MTERRVGPSPATVTRSPRAPEVASKDATLPGEHRAREVPEPEVEEVAPEPAAGRLDMTKKSTRLSPGDEGDWGVSAIDGSPFPVVYYNPLIVGERFVLGAGWEGIGRFVGGSFLAYSEEQERSVRLALAYHGKDKPDLWRLDDLKKIRSCKRCAFKTGNSDAWEDHDNAGLH